MLERCTTWSPQRHLSYTLRLWHILIEIFSWLEIFPGYLEGSGAHVLVLAPVSEGGCGVNHIGGTHELLHILGLAHVQNRADRCNYIDINTELIQVRERVEISDMMIDHLRLYYQIIFCIRGLGRVACKPADWRRDWLVLPEGSLRLQLPGPLLPTTGSQMDRHCRYGVSLSSHLPPGLLTGSYNVARLVVVIQSRSGGCFGLELR